MKGATDEYNQRRRFLKTALVATGCLPLAVGLSPAANASAVVSSAVDAPEPSPPAAPPSGYACFSAEQAAFVQATVNVLCPADDMTANGVDCGVATYIDRQLAGAFGSGDRLYMQGPWERGFPQQGYQLPLDPRRYFLAGIAAADATCVAAQGAKLEALPAPKADAFLLAVSEGKVSHPDLSLAAWFNELVYSLVVQGCFADPIYGGNRDKVFWKLVGYPGLPAFNAENVARFRGKPFPDAKTPHSIQDFS